ncbi:MAG: glutamyl-tRNA reductase, partial [Phycisphaerae bacterium]
LCDDPDRNRQIIQHFKHRLIQKILHLPISRLKDQARQGRGSMHAEALRQLFDLPDKE